MQIMKRRILITLLFFRIIVAHAQSEGLYFTKYYQPTIYQSGDLINDIIQDSQGRMIFGNNEGVLVYNGVTWKLIKLPDDTECKSLALANGTIYIGAYKQFGYLATSRSGDLYYVSMRDKLNNIKFNSEIYTINQVGNDIYFQSFTHIFRLREGKLKFWQSNEIEDNYQMAFVVNNRYFIKYRDGGIYEMVNDSLILVPHTQQFSKDRVYCMCALNTQDVLIGTQDNGLYRMKLVDNYTLTNQHFIQRHYTTFDTLFFNHQIYRGLKLSNGDIAISTRTGGIAILNDNGEVVKLINETNGIKGIDIKCLQQDKANLLWIGTSKGIYKAEIFSPWVFWDSQCGLDGVVNETIRFDGALYAGTNQGTYCLKNNGFVPVAGLRNWTHDFMIVNAKTNESNLMIGNKKGLYQLQNTKARLIHESRTIYNMFKPKNFPQYLIKIASENIEILDVHNLKRIVKRIDSYYGHPHKVIETVGNTIFISTHEKSLFRLNINDVNPDSITLSDYTTKLPEHPRTLSICDYMDTVFVNTNGTWFAYQHNTDSFVQKYPKFAKHLAPKSIIVNYHHLPNAKLIIAYKLNNTIKVGLFNFYNQSFDTTMFSRLTSIKQISFYSTHPDTLYFATNEGIFAFNFSNKYNDNSRFNVLIENIRLKGNIPADSFYLSENNSFVIDYKHNSISFSVAATAYTNETETKYSTFLVGYDKEWSEWTTNTRSEYINLREQQYTFKARAIDYKGRIIVSKNFTFEILPPWYRKTGFIVLYIVMLISFIYLIVRIYSHNLKKQNINLERIVAKRTDELHTKNIELEQQKEEISAQADELQRITDSLLVTNQQLNIQIEEVNQKNDEITKQNAIIESHNAFILSSINYAKYIQNVTMPPYKLIHSYFDTFILFLPKDIVSGDFYWFSPIKSADIRKRSIVAAVVDCTGHGVPGAFMTIIGKNLLDKLIFIDKLNQPMEILEKLNIELRIILRQDENENENGDGMDVCLCRIDFDLDNPVIYQVTFAGAKRPLFHYSTSRNELLTYKGSTKSIGGRNFSHLHYTEVKFEAISGDTLYLTSDGYTDQNNMAGKKFGITKFTSLLEQCAQLQVNEQHEIFENEILGYKKNSKQRDDITVVALKLR